jgi:uncharacterized protein YkwD
MLNFGRPQNGTLPPFVVKDPSLSSGGASISYPVDYEALADYLLGHINKVRLASGAQAVVLSPVPSGQQHADSMLFFDYFNHLDPQGYKPYVRYTLLNGTGAVEENIAWQHSADSSIVTERDVKQAIDRLEFEMLYDDSLYNWDHRANILDPDHTGVSIGIAYSQSDVYLVEDFENSLIMLSGPVSLETQTLTFTGSLSSAGIASAVVYFDPLPEAFDLSWLRVNGSMSLGYTPGTFVGGVIPQCEGSCFIPPSYVYAPSDGWQGGPGAVRVEVPLASFFSVGGRGIYTVYLQSSSGVTLTSHSTLLG